jgi:hypothetical protein
MPVTREDTQHRATVTRYYDEQVQTAETDRTTEQLQSTRRSAKRAAGPA